MGISVIYELVMFNKLKMNSILFFDWGKKNKPRLDLNKLFQELVNAAASNRIIAIADLEVAMDNTSRINLRYSSLGFEQSATERESRIAVSFTLPEDIYDNYILDFSFKNVPYFHEMCKYTIWYFDEVDVGRYDVINTKEYPLTVGTTIAINKNYNKNTNLILYIKER